MAEKWTFNSWATALVGIFVCQLHTLKICDVRCIVLCDKTAQFRVYSGLPKSQLFETFFRPFVCIEKVSKFKFGSKNKSVAFLFLFSVDGETQYRTVSYYIYNHRIIL